jgi:hypothetical protein
MYCSSPILYATPPAQLAATASTIDAAEPVEHDRFTGVSVDGRDQEESLRPAVARQPGRDGGTPPRLAGFVG